MEIVYFYQKEETCEAYESFEKFNCPKSITTNNYIIEFG